MRKALNAISNNGFQLCFEQQQHIKINMELPKVTTLKGTTYVIMCIFSPFNQYHYLRVISLYYFIANHMATKQSKHREIPLPHFLRLSVCPGYLAKVVGHNPEDSKSKRIPKVQTSP